MYKIEGIIFDWAGTTVDFGCFAPVHVFVHIFEEAGISVTMEEARKPMGMLKIDHIRTMLEMPRIAQLWEERYGKLPNEQDVEDLYAKFEPTLLESLSQYTTPIPGVLETVKELRDRGLKIGSTTGYNDVMMNIVVPHAKENGYAPDFWITPDSTNGYGRPYPFMIHRNMEELKLSSTKHVIKIGDTVSDIKEGIQAGVWSVGVVIGSSEMGLQLDEFYALSEDEQNQIIAKTEKTFKDNGAHFTIKTMRELPALIEEVNGLLEKEQYNEATINA